MKKKTPDIGPPDTLYKVNKHKKAYRQIQTLFVLQVGCKIRGTDQHGVNINPLQVGLGGFTAASPYLPTPLISLHAYDIFCE